MTREPLPPPPTARPPDPKPKAPPPPPKAAAKPAITLGSDRDLHVLPKIEPRHEPDPPPIELLPTRAVNLVDTLKAQLLMLLDDPDVQRKLASLTPQGYGSSGAAIEIPPSAPKTFDPKPSLIELLQDPEVLAVIDRRYARILDLHHDAFRRTPPGRPIA